MKQSHERITRRSFIKSVGAVGGAALITRGVHGATVSGLPMRTLGRTGVQVSALTLGTWPCGKCRELGTAGVEKLVREALDLGINSVDTARLYGEGETAIGNVAVQRDVMLVLRDDFPDFVDRHGRIVFKRIVAYQRNILTAKCLCIVCHCFLH